MDLHLKGKSIVITGGGTGIGRETALTFMKEGANVAERFGGIDVFLL